MSRRRRPDHVSAFEIVCVLVVVLSLIALVAWIVGTAGGGVLNQG
jgi:bacteriorhodopsin